MIAGSATISDRAEASQLLGDRFDCVAERRVVVRDSAAARSAALPAASSQRFADPGERDLRLRASARGGRAAAAIADGQLQPRAASQCCCQACRDWSIACSGLLQGGQDACELLVEPRAQRGLDRLHRGLLALPRSPWL